MTKPNNENGDYKRKFICIPPYHDAPPEKRSYEFINPDIIDFVFTGFDKSDPMVIIVFHKSCDRGNQKISANKATAVIEQLNELSIIPQIDL